MEELALRIRKNAGTLLYYVSIAILGTLFVISMIVGAWNIHQRYVTRKPNCIVNENPFRLPRSIFPSHYDVHLRPNLVDMTVNGSVEIDIDVAESSQCILVHVDELDVYDITLVEGPNKYEMKPLLVELNSTTDMLKLWFEKKLDENAPYKLKMNFAGKIRNDLRGFYHSSYETNDGRKITVAGTQFESTDARASFPCFDEPDMKATFKISFTTRPEDSSNPKFKVLSNMPQQSKNQLEDGSLHVAFQNSVKMSSYLVCYVLGEFDSVSTRHMDIDFTVYTFINEQSKGQFALDLSPRIVEFLSNFFDIKYSLPKMDLIAIPDFRAGAMENWGLITFRDLALYADENSPQVTKSRVADVVSHEIAHQWSGNLVTMRWWSDLWLNEGFATFFETFALDKLYPEKKLWESYLIGTTQPLLYYDSLPSTHSIVVSVNNQAEIYSVFDSISYNKGSAVLRMFLHHLEEPLFQKWMRAYFRKYQYNNTLTTDLFNTLGEVSDDPSIAANALTWTNQDGYPIIAIQEQGPNRYIFTQKRYLAFPPTTEMEKLNWWIPISYVDSNGRKVSTTFNKEMSSEIQVNAEWFKVNVGQVGLYRVNYTPSLWNKLIEAIKSSNMLSVADKFGLIDDVFALSKSGDLSIVYALSMAQALKNEENVVLWRALLSNLYKIDRLIANEAFSTNFRKFVRSVIEETVNKVGWEVQETDSDEVKELRVNILTAASHFEHQATIDECMRRFQDIATGNLSSVPVDLISNVINTAVRHGGESVFGQVYNMFLETIDPQQSLILLTSLSKSQIPSLLKRTLELSLTEKVKQQNGAFLIRGVTMNQYGTELAWNWIREKYHEIEQRFGARTTESALVVSGTSSFSSELKLKEVEDFFSNKMNSRSVRTAIELIRGNIYFMKNAAKDMRQYLENL